MAVSVRVHENEDKMNERVWKALEEKWAPIHKDLIEYNFKNKKHLEIGGKIVDIGVSKPDILNTIYYNENYEAPEVDYEFFAEYNMSMNNPKEYEPILSIPEGDYSLKFLIDHKSEILHLAYFEFYGCDTRVITKDELEIINAGVREVRADYESRLKDYYKNHKDEISTKAYKPDKAMESKKVTGDRNSICERILSFIFK